MNPNLMYGRVFEYSKRTLEHNNKIKMAIQTAMAAWCVEGDCAADPTSTSKIMAKYLKAMACINEAEDLETR